MTGCDMDNALCDGALDTHTVSFGEAPDLAHWTACLCVWHYREWKKLYEAMGYKEVGE